MRSIQRNMMQKAIDRVLKEEYENASRHEVKMMLLRMGLKPTLKTMYDYVVGPIIEREAAKKDKEPKLVSEVTAADGGPLIATPEQVKMIRR